jgi:DNA-binding HxlR family transcriptional regulator
LSKQERILGISQELSGQWTVPILLALEDCGGRFTPLQRQLEASPTRLSENLRRMIELGLIQHLSPYERNHPLLPEYVLTEKGKVYREAAKTIQNAELDIGAGRLSAKAWNIPILLALEYGHERFQDIRQTLKPITARMLSMRLDELNTENIIGKFVAVKPRPSFLYRLTKHVKSPVHQLSVDLREELNSKQWSEIV